MIEFYPEIRNVHIASVLLSGALFALRGALAVSGRQALALAAPLRYFSYTNDTILLTAALMLVSVLPSALFANGWLTAKLVLLVVYIGLGSLALKRARSPRTRLLCYLAALAVFASLFSIARAHHPAGFAARWLAQGPAPGCQEAARPYPVACAVA